MKKILIIGQLPKEYGGTYTTGVANVIISVLPFIPSDKYEKHLWASNIPKNKNRDIHNTKVYGIQKFRLLFSFINYFIKYPQRILSYKKYLKYGIKPLRNLVYEICVNKLINKIKPDIIHVHNIGFLPSVFYANNKNNKNILLTYHGIFYNDVHSIDQSFKNGIDLKKLFYNASHLVNNFTVLTEQMKNDAVQQLDVLYTNISLVANGVGRGFFYDEAERIKLRNKLEIKDFDNVFISVGALTKRKNHIKAIKFLQNNFKEFQYLIIGREGDYRDEILNEIKKDKRISIISYVNNSELFKYYSAADFFIMPSTQEGQSLVCLEAFSSGLPVLINEDIISTLGVPNCFKNYYKGIDLEVNEFDSLEKLNVKEKENLVFLSKENLSWNKVALKYVLIYEKSINKNN